MVELGKTGGSIVLYNFMDNLVKRGHEVFVILPNKRIKWEIGMWKVEKTETFVTKIKLLIWKYMKLAIKKNQKIQQIHYFNYLERVTKGIIKNWVKSDITISTFCLTAYAGYFLSDKTIPLYHMQGFDEVFFNDKSQRLIARNTYNLPLIKIANSEWLKNIISNKLDVKCRFLLNPGIDTSIFKPCFNIDKKYTNKQEWIIVSYFSELPLKGFDDAAKAVKLARNVLGKKGIKIKWKIYGFKPPSKKYETDFEFIGPVFGDKLAELYSEADLVLMTSWYESFPLPPLEAMACGSLIITTKFGTEDYVFDGVNGLVCLPKKIEEISGKIIYAINNPNHCLKMVKQGLNTAESYSWEKRTDLLEEIFENAKLNYNFDKYYLFDDLVHGKFREELFNEFNMN